MAGHLAKLAWLGALKAVDGLLFVANGKEGAVFFTGALSGEKLLCQAGDHLPLVGAGILRFIDEDMVKAAVQFIEHPGGVIAALQQAGGVFDEVLIIEGGALLLLLLEAGDDFVSKGEQLHGGAGNGEAVISGEGFCEAVLGGGEAVDQRRVVIRYGFGDE